MRRLVMLALASTLVAGCSIDSTGPYGSVAGDYSLRTINGQTLPYTFSGGLQLVSEDLTLYRDGSYEDVSYYSDGSTFFDDGYYDNYNGSLTFHSSDGSTFQGSVSGSTLTQIYNGYTQVFRRE